MLRNNISTINIATLAFLDEVTLKPSIGGLQRWTRDLAKFLNSKGYNVIIYQKSSRAFETFFSEGIQVIGIKSPMRFYGNFLYSRKLAKVTSKADPVIFLSQELMLGANWSNCISINHGIWWDSDFLFFKRLFNKWFQSKILKYSSLIICVDTNYINWCHAEISGRFIWREKMRYLPNYADSDIFSFKQIHSKKTEYFKILCPRRMTDDLASQLDGRGILILLEALVILNNLDFPFIAEFAGSGKAKEEALTFAVEHGFGGKIICSQYQLDEIADAYSQADIVVIPSASHEGTSLSAVEAMCSGCATVVTHIGGLPNLVIDGVNGFMADLSPRGLADTIIRSSKICRDVNWKKKCSELSINAFGKKAWEKKINDYLSSVLGNELKDKSFNL
jgi:glycosyltransferase involved in cell wall biosynthesis